MTNNTTTTRTATIRSNAALAPAAAPRQPRAARAVLRLLGQLRHGRLDLQLPDGSSLCLGPKVGTAVTATATNAGASSAGAVARNPADHIHAVMRFNDWAAFQRVLRAGDIGLAEGYIAGEWDSPDLSALLSLLIGNREALEQVVYGSWWGSLAYRLKHLLNRNSRRGSAKNIHAHYDLGNRFYAQWLDPSMSYSSAWFDGDFSQSMAQAQQAKMRRALQEAGVGPGSRVLEIGCGWGSMASMAAGEFGAHVTGVTLSTEQLAWAQASLAQAGQAPSTDLRLQDYRDLAAQGQTYDAVVSIEMFEAVGHEYWDSYFQTLRDCLKPGGLACIQSITIRDDLFDRYRRSTDFIQQYIFPGGLLPSVGQFEALAKRHGFTVQRRLAFGTDYAKTLRRWRADFVRNESGVRALGFDTRFVRIWLFYLAYCEAAFEQGNTDVVQFTLRRD